MGVERMYGRSVTGDSGETICPYCKKNAAMVYVDESARIVDLREMRGEAAFQCYACKRFVIGGKLHLGLMNPGEPEHMQAWMFHADSYSGDIADALIGRVEYWEPISPVGHETKDVPEEIAASIDEAYRCFSIGAFRAAVLMARGVIEAAAKASDVTSGNLASKIDKLAERGQLRAIVAESAHQIRHIGNDVAHGDFATTAVEKEDAQDVLELMDDVVEELFVLPTRVQRRLDRRKPIE